MVIDIVALLRDNPTLVFFVVLGAGYLLGNIRWGIFELGPTAGVLLAGLFFGHHGFSMPKTIQEIGFILFIYSVGFQAGPRFVSVFLEDGLKYASLALVVAVTAIALAKGISLAIGFNPGLMGGMLAGALTSTPTLAAAQDAVASGMAQTGGVSHEQLLSDLSVGYAITYIFGMVGLIAFIRLLPRLMRFDLKAEAAALAMEKKVRDEGEEHEPEPELKPMIRAFEVRNVDVVGRPLEDLHFCKSTGCVIQEVRRGGETLIPDESTRLEHGDRVSIVGPLDKLEGLSETIGPGVWDKQLLKAPIESALVIISNKQTAGKRISDLHTVARFGCFITRIVRAQIELPVSPEIVLEKGDAVTVAGVRGRLKELIAILGHEERGVVKTDLLTFAFGIVLGIVLGQFSVKVGHFSLGLGTAGGLLLSGIAVGFLRSLHPTFGRVPPAARWVLMELGLLFFMAGVGLQAGKGIVDALLSVGAPLFLSGVVVTLVPVLVGFAFGRYVLKLNPALLLGGITGAMTSTPSLNVICQDAGNSMPALGYAGAYTFANVFLALGGGLLLML